MTLIRTRFAPSPTGFMHIGNLRTGLYAYMFARKNGGRFILRIEDTDHERQVEGAVEAIYRTLEIAGMDYDEGPDRDGGFGPYVQSERVGIYKKYADELVEKGGAYYCFCTKERLATLEGEGGVHTYDKHCRNISLNEAKKRIAAGDSYVVRQKVPQGVVSSYEDLVFGEIFVASEDIEDGVLLKADGMPTYNFANVVDDHLMGITHVMRGTEYLSSTPKYNLIYDAFGWPRPTYIHLPPIMKDATRKLSKRFGDANFEDFIKRGYLPEAIINYIALLGWCPKDNREKMTLGEMTEAFSIDGISKSSSIFDEAKMRWLNGEYLKAMDENEFFAVAKPYISKSKAGGKFNDFEISKLMHTRVDVLEDIPEKIDFLIDFGNYDLGMFLHQKMKVDFNVAKQSLKACASALEALDDWNEDGIRAAISQAAIIASLKGGQLMFSMRVALTGQPVTPGGAIEMAAVLGKEESLNRIAYSQKLLDEYDA